MRQHQKDTWHLDFSHVTFAEHTAAIKNSKLLSVSLCQFDSLSHVLDRIEGHDGGQAVGRKIPTTRNKRNECTNRNCVTFWGHTLPSIMHYRVYIIRNVEGVALFLVEVPLTTWKTDTFVKLLSKKLNPWILKSLFLVLPFSYIGFYFTLEKLLLL